jgi:hypothetical protein
MGPLCPVIYINSGEPCSFTKVPEGPQTYNLKCPLGPRKEPRYTFLFSKILADEPPPGSPTVPLWRKIPVYRAFCISLENLVKIPLNKKVLIKKCSSMFPKSRTLMETDAQFQVLLNLLKSSIFFTYHQA